MDSSLLILVPVMDIGHVAVLVLCMWMVVLVGMSNIGSVVFMKLIMSVSVLMHDRHMDMEMSVLFIRQ